MRRVSVECVDIFLCIARMCCKCALMPLNYCAITGHPFIVLHFSLYSILSVNLCIKHVCEYRFGTCSF